MKFDEAIQVALFQLVFFTIIKCLTVEFKKKHYPWFFREIWRIKII